MTISEYRAKLLRELNDSKKELDDETKAALNLAGDSTGISKLIKVINDESSSMEEKGSAIASLNAISIFSPVLRTKMPEMVNALRGQMNSSDEGIRNQVFGTLSALKDEVAQEQLVAEIESDTAESDKLIPTAKAIAMLGSDEKALPASLLQEVAANPPDPESLIESIRHMSAEPESFELLKSIMEDDRQPLEARAMIPEMLNKIRPDAFLESASSLLQANGANDELAPFLARGVAGVHEEEHSDKVENTKSLIKELLEDSPHSFKSLAQELLFEDDESAKDE